MSHLTRSLTLGIISALAFNPDFSGTYAAGTFSSSTHPIALFDPDIGANPTMLLGGVRTGGITQIIFHPTRQHVVYAASRRSGFIQEWDLRNPLMVMNELKRADEESSEGTNQRMRMDVDIGGRWLAAGNEVRSSYWRVLPFAEHKLPGRLGRYPSLTCPEQRSSPVPRAFGMMLTWVCVYCFFGLDVS